MDFWEADRFRSTKSFKALVHISRCWLIALHFSGGRFLDAKFAQSRLIASRTAAISHLTLSSSVIITLYFEGRPCLSFVSIGASKKPMLLKYMPCNLEQVHTPSFIFRELSRISASIFKGRFQFSWFLIVPQAFRCWEFERTRRKK